MTFTQKKEDRLESKLAFYKTLLDTQLHIQATTTKKWNCLNSKEMENRVLRKKRIDKIHRRMNRIFKILESK